MTSRFDSNPTLPGAADPYPVYRLVRESDPVHWCAEARLWAVTRCDDAEAVLISPPRCWQLRERAARFSRTRRGDLCGWPRARHRYDCE
jgi:hypothetical protein